MVAIIDYDAGNIKSVQKALAKLGQEAEITSEAEKILAANRIILPGVGAFGDAMQNLRARGLDGVIHRAVDAGIPFLGICLGQQLLFERSDEAPGVEGLGIVEGEILRIPAAKGLKIPHMGWNSLHLSHGGRLFRGVEEQSYVYFVHSYYLKARDGDIVKASTEYGVEIHASVEKDNVFACQFHPEKSGGAGLRILGNFLEVE